MEGEFLEALFLPWWKGLVYIFAITLSIVTIRVTIKLDLNAWLKRRDEAKRLAERKESVITCRHAWTLYSISPFSQCSFCQAWISTPILLAARQLLTEDEPLILAENPTAVVTLPKGGFVVDNYRGVGVSAGG